MGVSRQGENEGFRDRSVRLHNVGDDWYFTTRGGHEYGPFPDRAAAEAALRDFVREQVMHDDVHDSGPDAPAE